MEIKWVGSPNYGKGRIDKNGKTYKPLAIIDHIMAGTLVGTDSWFNNPSSQASSHYGVGRNGEVHQYVREEDTAWANGRKLEPNTEWLANFPAVNPNYWTISIEHEGYPDKPMTQAQINATIELHRYLANKWNIPIDDTHITGHFRIDSVNRKSCPGPNFPWTQLFAALKPAPVVKEEPKVETPQPEQWMIDIMKDAEAKGIIDVAAKHGALDLTPKWFAVAVALNAIKYLEKKGCDCCAKSQDVPPAQ